MHSLYANVRNETEKLLTRRKTKGFLLLTVLLPAISAALLTAVQTNSGVAGGLGNNLPILMLGMFTFALLPLFLFMTAADSFAGEISARTLQLVLVRPITRGKVFASKVLAIAVGTAVLLGVLWIASVLSGWIITGGDITGGLTDSLIAYAASGLPMLAIGLFTVLIAQGFKNGTGVIALIILIYAAAKVIPFILPQFSVWSVFSYTDWYVLWVGNGAPASQLLSSTVLLLAYCIIAYTAGLMIFERKQM